MYRVRISKFHVCCCETGIQVDFIYKPGDSQGAKTVSDVSYLRIEEKERKGMVRRG